MYFCLCIGPSIDQLSHIHCTCTITDVSVRLEFLTFNEELSEKLYTPSYIGVLPMLWHLN